MTITTKVVMTMAAMMMMIFTGQENLMQKLKTWVEIMVVIQCL